MRKFIAVSVLVAGLCGVVRADVLPRFGDLYDSFTHGARVHFLDNAKTGYYRDLVNGENRGAALSDFINYGPLAASAGATTGSFDVTPTRELSAIMGITINATQVIGTLYPQIKEFTYSVTPDSSHKLLDKTWVGFVLNHEFNYDPERRQWTYGVVAGISF